MCEGKRGFKETFCVRRAAAGNICARIVTSQEVSQGTDKQQLRGKILLTFSIFGLPFQENNNPLKPYLMVNTAINETYIQLPIINCRETVVYLCKNQTSVWPCFANKMGDSSFWLRRDRYPYHI